MVRICLAGFGNMGRTHFERYQRLTGEGEPVALVALYDLDRARFSQVQGEDVRFYDDFDEMLDREKPDAVDITLPDHLHARYAIQAMNRGVDVLCEKPMALSPEQVSAMLETAKRTGRRLMIAHCCRFMDAYALLRQYVMEGRLGRPQMAGFYRMSGPPTWSRDGWLLNAQASGGCLLDMHIHDVDILQWVFGMPSALCALGINAISGAGIDGLSTQYKYPGFIANIQANWSVFGKDVSFLSGYHVEFERGSILSRNGTTTVYQVDCDPIVRHDDEVHDGYYREILEFVRCIQQERPVGNAQASSVAKSMELVFLERDSILEDGAWMRVQV
jgi:predicted dehydrogenase